MAMPYAVNTKAYGSCPCTAQLPVPRAAVAIVHTVVAIRRVPVAEGEAPKAGPWPPSQYMHAYVYPGVTSWFLLGDEDIVNGHVL